MRFTPLGIMMLMLGGAGVVIAVLAILSGTPFSHNPIADIGLKALMLLASVAAILLSEVRA